MILARIISLIDMYAPWLYLLGLLGLLYALYELWAARKSRAETIFSLEKEFAARREGRARMLLIAAVALLTVVTVLKFGLAPGDTLIPTPVPTPTRLVLVPPTEVPVTPTPTRTPIPTRPRPTAPPPATPTPTAPAAVPTAPCPRLDICISSPAPNSTVSGQVTIRGTANIEAFQFYKVEYGMGEEPIQWNSIGDVRRERVVNGTLAMWDTSGFPQGPYILRLTVVDLSGNFPTPHEVRVVIQPQ
jgi:hypothetical protein